MPELSTHRPRVLLLSKWYPDKFDPMPGLFIRQLAESLSDKVDIAVLYVQPDPHCSNNFELEYSHENGVEVVRVYYSPGKNPVTKWMKFYRAHRRGLDFYRGFRPDLIHANILTRVGFIAFLFSLRLRIPFIISEHWSRYFPLNGTYRGLLRKMITGFVAARATTLVAVSESLKNAMIQQGIRNKDFRVVPNGVDMTRFTPAGQMNSDRIKHIIHISCFEDRSKNISGLLGILRNLAGERQDFTCHFVGEGPDFGAMKELAASLNFPDGVIRFEGLVEGTALAEMIRKSDFSILSSNYETFGTVILESLSSGIPVAATRVGIAPDVINSVNGLIAAPGEPGELSDAISYLLDNCREYDKAVIRESILQGYSKESVASQVLSIYQQAIGTHV